MKKSFRILAVVLAATMLMCCCAFAVDSSRAGSTRGQVAFIYEPDGAPGYATCSAGQTGASATLFYDEVIRNLKVELDTEVFTIALGYVPAGSNSSNGYLPNVSTSVSYYAFLSANAYSRHYIDGSLEETVGDSFNI